MSLFTRNRARSVASLGEEKLIAAIQKWLGTASPRRPFGIGDDCAQLPASRRAQLITVDPVIAGRHFDDSVKPRDVGEKLLKRNLSDIAAMGGVPTAAVLAVSLDPRTNLIWLEAFYRGLAACARRFGVAIVGGDLAQANATFIASLTLLGTSTGSRVLTREGAKLGDEIYVTGRLGGSLASGHHYRFTPRLAEGAWLARQRAVRSMMDVSDGLAKDIHALTPKGTTASLDRASLPRRSGCTLRAALTEGEDYELLFTVAAKTHADTFARQWHEQFPRTPLAHIGRFESKNAVTPGSIDLHSYHGYEHLR